MSFKEKVKAILEDKLKDGNTNLLESIEEFAADTGLNESEQTAVLSAISKYADSAYSKVLDTVLESVETEVEAEKTTLQESYEEKEQQLNEASEAYATYLSEGTEAYAEYVQNEYKDLYESYTNDVVMPELSETLDSYIAIMATKLDEDGSSAVNVLKATKYNELVENLSQLGFSTKPLVESEEELSEIAQLQAKLKEAQDELKSLGSKLSESNGKYVKEKAEKFINEAVEGLTDLQADKVRKLAARLDEKSDSFEDLVTDLVETVKGRSTTKRDDEQQDLNESEKPKYSNMERYLEAARPKQTRL